MRYVVNNVRLLIDEDIENLNMQLYRKLGISSEEIRNFRIIREAVDARRKNRIEFVYSIEIEVDGKLRREISDVRMIEETEITSLITGTTKLENRPIIVGTGPAGMFAGLILAKNGYKPLLLERGSVVEQRTKALNKFWEEGKIDPEVNVQFGEGGAGTFSDGKLTTRINDPRVSSVLKEFIQAGAQEEIGYKAKPHIGTDILRDVVKNIRNRIIELGGEVRFNSKVNDVLIDFNSFVKGVKVREGIIESQIVVIAAGHSARDVYEFLFKRNVKLISKPFSIGVRIEHPQEFIDKAQYGDFAGHPRLGPAEYQLAFKQGERAAYTFCMCPGGVVVAAASDEGEVVTNGMSYHARDGRNANSAFVVSVGPEDFENSHPLAGIEFQKTWEKIAFCAGGRKYLAPAQTLGDFIDKRSTTKFGEVLSTYMPGVVPYDLTKCLPGFVVDMMMKAIGDFDKKIKGFAMKDALLTGVETRTSAPIRVLRNNSFEAEGITGLYPAGEGAGYAGGIVSAAVDGIRVAEAIMAKYKIAD